MLKVGSYSHLTTKIRAMLGKMLTDHDYDQMVVMNDVKSVVLYLKHNTYYKTALAELDDNDIHRGHVEVLLYRAELTDSLKIARYLKGNDKKIYRYVYRKQEIEDLKKMLRTLQQGKSLSTLDRKRLFVSVHSRIDFNKALEADSIVALLDTIKNTKFYDVLKPLVKDENSIDLFAAEMALDMYYFRAIKDNIKSMASGKDKEILNKYFGTEADINNIMWIYRGKHYYNLGKEQLYRYLIPYRNKMKQKMFDDMIEAPDSEKVVELIRQSPYKEVVSGSVFDWEHDFMAYLLRIQLRSLRLHPYSMAPIIGYVYAKEAEINNITTIIEGVRYQVDSERIKASLIVGKT